jgi:thymidylate synthase (FAD)
MQVKLISKTVGVGDFSGRSVDELILGQARISSNRKDLFGQPERLLRHFVNNQHWSVFTMADLGFQIITSRAMSHELIRHWSLDFQEFSQRYSPVVYCEPIELREKSESRQSSSVPFTKTLQYNPNEVAGMLLEIYHEFLTNDVAPETARFILPETTQTKLNVKGDLRSWITFLNARLHKTAQKEIRLIAEEIKDAFITECPIIAKCFYNFEDAYEVPFLDRIILEKYKDEQL